MIPLITLEEHFLDASTPALKDAYAEQLKFLKGVEDKLLDVGPLRLKSMDAGAVNLQIVSHAPGMGSVDPGECVIANNNLHSKIKSNKRFAGFAVLSLTDPKAAADELRRCVKELGFVGTLIDNHLNGQHYDGPEFHSLFEAAQELDVPIYLHPTWPTEDMKVHNRGNFPEGAAASMGSSGFGWHADTHLHVLKLFAAGVFDKFPNLKIIVGHFGEMIPFQLERITYLSGRWGERKKDFKQVYDDNIWITTSGVWSIHPMACILGNTKIDHILYSVDYPFAQNKWGLKFMEDLQKSGLVTKEQLEMIGYKNAEKLLRVKVQ